MTIGLGPHGTGVLRLARPGVLLHWCDGCCRGHEVNIHDLNRDGKVIGWDGDIKRPSFGETVRHEDAGAICEYVLRAGVMYFASSCTHPLANQQRTLREFPIYADPHRSSAPG